MVSTAQSTRCDDHGMEPTAEVFAALARSSPWRWRTLRFTAAWRGRDREPVRAWLRRPDGLRVESLDGELLVATEAASLQGVLLPDGRVREERRVTPLAADAPRPELRPDGLVARRPDAGWLSYDDPMFVDYAWVAMLDPAEFADGVDHDTGERRPDPVRISGLSAVDHHGRPAWQAELAPTPSYSPRCGCCPLLPSQVSDDAEAAIGGPTRREYEPDLRYADAHRVRLDVATGVCVYTEEIGGTHAGSGHDLRIEAVDEPMDSALFRP